MTEATEQMVELVRGNGDEVGIHEPPCVIWKADHKNCEGCQYELGCAKVVRLLLSMMPTMIYTPKDYDDFAKMDARIQELMAKILKTTTPNELKSIPMH